MPRQPNVRFVPKADIEVRRHDIRFTLESRHWLSVSAGPLCARSGHRQLFDHLVGATKQ
jgi:hypothetical protein